MMICETKYSNNKLVSQNKVSYRPHPRYITLIIIEHVVSNYLSGRRLKCLRSLQLVGPTQVTAKKTHNTVILKLVGKKISLHKVAPTFYRVLYVDSKLHDRR